MARGPDEDHVFNAVGSSFRDMILRGRACIPNVCETLTRQCSLRPVVCTSPVTFSTQRCLRGLTYVLPASLPNVDQESGGEMVA
jgi:hypothetical protein